MNKYDYKNIRVDIKSGVATLTFNRPGVCNALNSATIDETLGAVQKLENDPCARVIILTGEGRAFVAGADISEMIDKTSQEARQYSELGHRLMNTIQYMAKPVIAAVNGYALGGGTELALACDIRLASENARFGLPETTIGVIPGWGATQRTARLIGTSFAKELILTGSIIDAQRALAIGLVNRVFPAEELMDEAVTMAKKIAGNGQTAISHEKKIINNGSDLSFREGCKLETTAFAACFSTEDQKEGMRAFIEKRKPDFRGE